MADKRQTRLRLEAMKDMLRSRLCLEMDIEDDDIYDLRDIFEDLFPSSECYGFPSPKEDSDDE